VSCRDFYGDLEPQFYLILVVTDSHMSSSQIKVLNGERMGATRIDLQSPLLARGENRCKTKRDDQRAIEYR
jgi:hypothetical protein